MQGIMFIEYLFHRTVRGLKTQTRRTGGLQKVNDDPTDWELMRFALGHAKFTQRFNAINEVYCKPKYALNSIIYLKEPILVLDNFKDHPELDCFYFFDQAAKARAAFKGRWTNKMFMPASRARHFIQITDIRVERLQDISDKDCLAEGIESITARKNSYCNYMYKLADGVPLQVAKSIRHSFFSLFKWANKIPKAKPVPNPWVFVYTFKLLTDYKP
jgi:hypothetical protein